MGLMSSELYFSYVTVVSCLNCVPGFQNQYYAISTSNVICCLLLLFHLLQTFLDNQRLKESKLVTLKNLILTVLVSVAISYASSLHIELYFINFHDHPSSSLSGYSQNVICFREVSIMTFDNQVYK